MIDSSIYNAKKLKISKTRFSSILFAQQNGNLHTQVGSFLKISFLLSSLIRTDATNHFGGIIPSSSHFVTGQVPHLSTDTHTASIWGPFKAPPGFPGGSSGKEPTCQCRRCKRHGFNPWIGKIPWIIHSNKILAWRIPWIEELGGLQSIEWHRVRYNWSDLTHTHTVHQLYYTLDQTNPSASYFHSQVLSLCCPTKNKR